MPARRRIRSGGGTAVVEGGGGVVITEGPPTGKWAEDVRVDDHPVVGPRVGEDATVDDAFTSLLVANPEDATVDDSMTSTTSPRFAEDVVADDALVMLASNPENATADDALASTLWRTPENATVDDAIPLASVRGLSEDATANDLVRTQMINVDVARTVTPDSDKMVDAWVDQAAPGVNHGNESLSVKGKSTLANDEQVGLVAIDFRDLSGFSTVGSGFSYVFWASTNSVLGATALSWNIGHKSTSPFTESAVTWNSGFSSDGTIAASTINIATGAAQQYTINAGAGAPLNAVLGGWLTIRFFMPTTATPNTVTILSRDNAVSGDRPKFNITVQRGT